MSVLDFVGYTFTVMTALAVLIIVVAVTWNSFK